MALAYLEAANACVGIGVFIAFLVTFIVALANLDCCVDTSNIDNATLAELRYVGDTVTSTLSDLDIDVDSYGPALKVGCQLAALNCPHKISGVAVASIVTGVISVLAFLLGLWFRAERRKTYARHGRKQLYPEL